MKDNFTRGEIQPLQGQINIGKLRKQEFRNFMSCSKFFNIQFNLTINMLNLTSCTVTLHKPMQSQTDASWDLISHQNEILHSLVFILVWSFLQISCSSQNIHCIIIHKIPRIRSMYLGTLLCTLINKHLNLWNLTTVWKFLATENRNQWV